MLYLITADAALEIKQGGREHILAPGDSIFVRGGEVSIISCQKQSRFTNIAIALDDLRSRYSGADDLARSEEHKSELQSLMRISYAVFCLKKKNRIANTANNM